jgi:hypothetical protein
MPSGEGGWIATPNRLEANFKSNKYKSMPKDAPSALEMEEKNKSLKDSQSHTSNLFSPKP